MNEPKPEFEKGEHIDLSSDPELAVKQMADRIQKKYQSQFGGKSGLPNLDDIFSSTMNELYKMDLPNALTVVDTEIDEDSGRVDFTIEGPAELIDMMRPIVEK